MKRFSGKFCSVLALLVIIAAASPGCRSGVPEASSGKPPPLLLISIDGLRHDYIGQFDSPALDRMIDEGLYADSLMQVFPTKTFAAHYSLATGLYPGTHGVVANSMWDPQRRQFFSMRNRKAVSDGFWFQGGEPIWVTAEKQGLTAATFFWPGSEAMIKRTRPTYWRSYDGRVSHTRRINQALDWLPCRTAIGPTSSPCISAASIPAPTATAPPPTAFLPQQPKSTGSWAACSTRWKKRAALTKSTSSWCPITACRPSAASAPLCLTVIWTLPGCACPTGGRRRRYGPPACRPKRLSRPLKTSRICASGPNRPFPNAITSAATSAFPTCWPKPTPAG